ANHRFHRVVVVQRHPGLRLRAVPDGIAWPWAHLLRIVQPAVRGSAGAVFDGAAYRLADDLFRHDRDRGVDRRLHPAAVRPRDRGPARNHHRGRTGDGLRRRTEADRREHEMTTIAVSTDEA